MEFVLHILSWPKFGSGRFFNGINLAFQHLYDHFLPHSRNNYHPYILSNKMAMLFSGLLLAVKIFTLAIVSIGSVSPAFSSAITAENIVKLTNESRKAHTLKVLSENSVLHLAAQHKANDMAVKGYFSHQSPDGKMPWDFLKNVNYNYLSAGENLAVNFFEAESIENAWMNSPGHRANILNQEFEEIGIGIAQGTYQGRVATFVVQMFGVPSGQKITLSKISTTVATEPIPKPLSEYLKENNPPIELNEPLIITEATTQIHKNVVKLNVKVSSSAVKVLVKFGNAAVMLNPKDNGVWEGAVSLENPIIFLKQVKVFAFDIQGHAKDLAVAEFGNGGVNNFKVLGSSIVSENKTGSVQVSWFKKQFDLINATQKFYLIFVAATLVCLILGIGIKKHIQHVSLVANGSLVGILGMLLWVSS